MSSSDISHVIMQSRSSINTLAADIIVGYSAYCNQLCATFVFLRRYFLLGIMVVLSLLAYNSMVPRRPNVTIEQHQQEVIRATQMQ